MRCCVPGTGDLPAYSREAFAALATLLAVNGSRWLAATTSVSRNGTGTYVLLGQKP